MNTKNLGSWTKLGFFKSIILKFFSIYLVDHAWTFRRQTARQQLTSHPGLAERMAALLDITWDEDERETIIDTILVKNSDL